MSLKDCIVRDDQFFNAVSSSPPRKYFIDAVLQANILNETVKFKNVFGLCQMRGIGKTMLTFDMDRKDFKTLDDDTVLMYVSKIRTLLRSLKMIDSEGRHVDLSCVILRKEPIDKKGVHLHFPMVFIPSNLYEFIQNEMKKDGFDSTYNKPWLYHGYKKSEDDSCYFVYKVINTDGDELDKDEYLRSYFEKEHLYPLIKPTWTALLGIKSLHRSCVDEYTIPSDKPIKSSFRKYKNDDNFDSETVLSRIEEYFEGSSVSDRGDGSYLVSFDQPWYCDCCSRTHDRKDGVVNVRQGKAWFNCFTSGTKQILLFKIT